MRVHLGTAIAGFAIGDFIHLAGFTETSFQVSGVSADGIVTVTLAGTFKGAAATESFSLITAKTVKLSVTSDGAGGANIALTPTPPPTAILTWNNQAGGDFGAAANWTPAAAPNATTSTTISAAGAYTVTVAAGENAAVQDLTLNNADGILNVAGTLTVTDGLTLSNGLITGVGTASNTSTDPGLIERVNAMQNAPPLTREDFEAYTFGDIGGVYLLRPDLAERIALRNAKTGALTGNALSERKAIVEAKVKRINAQWTGIQREHVARCAERARSSQQTPGVIVLAVGRAKSGIVIEAVNQSLVNHLLIDQDLADALVEDLDD